MNSTTVFGMGRRVMVGLATFVALVFASSSLYSMVNAAAPDTMVIKIFQKKKAPVPFAHKKHIDAKIECKTCHHTTEAGKDPAACTTCHKAEADGTTPKAEKAFHKSCIDCHKKDAKAGKASGPTKCGECHKG